jgi:hypothetical protein
MVGVNGGNWLSWWGASHQASLSKIWAMPAFQAIHMLVSHNFLFNGFSFYSIRQLLHLFWEGTLIAMLQHLFTYNHFLGYFVLFRWRVWFCILFVRSIGRKLCSLSQNSDFLKFMKKVQFLIIHIFWHILDLGIIHLINFYEFCCFFLPLILHQLMRY